MGDEMRIRFFGVRGSIPTPTRDNLRYGGNTACLEVWSDAGARLIIDGGTGLYSLGAEMLQQPGDAKFALCLSHFHWDHVQGIPFFAPMYRPGSACEIYSGFPVEQTRAALEGQMAPRHFPVSFGQFSASVSISQLGGVATEFADTSIRAFPLNHPGGCWGFRVENGSHSVVYASDLEHGDAEADDTLRRASEGASVLIYDAHFTPEEYEQHRGWGHSSWLEATRLARSAGVRTLVLTHHAPARSDDALDQIVERARCEFAETEAARENWSIEL
jgi:phosphoribosyl 1,2-cyclic phosphodiesterase